MSAYSMLAGTTLGGWKSPASASKRLSGTLAIPSWTLVAPIRLSEAVPVKILKRQVLPTCGSPMMAVFMRTLRLHLGTATAKST